MIQAEVKKGFIQEFDTDVLVVPIFQDGTFPNVTKDLDKSVQGALSRDVKQNKFEGESGKTLLVSNPGLKAKKVLLLGVGKKGELNRNSIRDAYASAANDIASTKYEQVAIGYVNDKGIEPNFDAAVEGFLLATYRFNKYKKKPERPLSIKGVCVVTSDAKTVAKFGKQLERVQIMVEATCFARDLINEPANIVNPSYMEKQAIRIAKETGLKLKVFHEAELQKEGMNLILAVGMGSEERPRMVHLEYKPKAKAKRTVALVGKGVCFDSGGLSLKSQDNMYGMKADMSGSAAVLAAMWAIAELELPVHVHGVFPLVENMPSGSAVRPGDVFVGHNGKSVEIENTDAEGRLILADALSYVASLNVDEILDTATLTGACVVALGEDIAGTFSDHPALVKKIQQASQKVGEKFWQMPIEKAYKRMLKSDVADMKNVGARWGGAITAALFLQEFAPPNVAWAHLDIAGPAHVGHDQPICIKGGTGFAVRTFVEFVTT